jgi:cobaltochelatase CobS
MSQAIETHEQLRGLIATLTHRQLVRYLRALVGGSLGFDYMKVSKADLINRATAAVDLGGFEHAKAKLAEAFPEGVYARGERHTSKATDGGHSDESEESAESEESEESAAPAVNLDATLAEIRGLIMDGGLKAADPVIRQLITLANKPAERVEVPVYLTGPATVPAGDGSITHAMPTADSKTWGALFNVKGALGKRTSVLWNGAHPETPAVDSSYVWPPVTGMALTQLGRDKNVFFYGPPGTGKTHWTAQYAAKLGRPFALIACDDQTDAPTLVGMTVPSKDGGTGWQDGILTRAIQTPGCVICIDEPSLARAGALMAMQNVLAHRVLYIAETGRRVPVAHGVQFIACDNTNGTGGGALHGFTGTGRLNAAFLDRFGAFCHFEYLSATQESNVIVRATRCSKTLADLLVSAANTTRQAAGNGSLTTGISLRVLFAWAELLTDGVPAREAFEAAVLNRAPEQDRESLNQQCLLTYDAAAIDAAVKS